MTRCLTLLIATAISMFCCGNLVSSDQQPDEQLVERILREFRNPKSEHVMVVAHRGGWRHAREYNAPENSLANIDKAVRLGYDVFETDVSRTKDGHLILMHDPSVSRTTNGNGKVRDLTLAEIKELRLRVASGKKEITDQQVPTFQEALRRAKGRIMFKIDLKSGVGSLQQVLDELIAEKMLEHAMIRVGDRGSSIRGVKETLAMSPKCEKAIILFRCKSLERVQQVIREFHPPVIEIQGVDLGITAEHREMAKAILTSGARVEAHASEDPADWPAQIEIGISAFHTKWPRIMIAWLRERELHW